MGCSIGQFHRFMHVQLHFDCQSFATAIEAAFNGADLDATDFGRFFVGVLQNPDQGQDFALFGGQLFKRRPEFCQL